MKLYLLGLILVLTVAFSMSARAAAVGGLDPVLLTIDLTDPYNAVITATGLDPMKDSKAAEGLGVDLLQFFSAPQSFTYSEGNSSTLVGASNDAPYDSYVTDHHSGALTDLNLYVSGGSQTNQVFSKTSPAFSGSFTVNLSAFIGELPTLNEEGYILVGNDQSFGKIIGLWEVVPEPSAYGMYAFLAFAALIGWRRLSVSRQAIRA
jgi:hypothetical protein